MIMKNIKVACMIYLYKENIFVVTEGWLFINEETFIETKGLIKLISILLCTNN
jgi:hypothetical protein